MTRRGGLGALVIAGLLVVGGTGARAACDIDEVAARYGAALDHHRAGNQGQALPLWRELAEQGIGPAQTWLARYLARGTGGAVADKEKALFWAVLGSHGRDAAASPLALELEAALSKEAAARARKRVGSWSPRLPDCLRDAGTRLEVKDSHRARRGRLEIGVETSLASDGAAVVFKRMPGILDRAVRFQPLGQAYLPLVDRLRVFGGDRYDRYIGESRRDSGLVLMFSSGNLLDRGPALVGMALAVESARVVLARLPEVRMQDPLMREIAGKRVYGSPYPDVDNEVLFRSLERSLARAPKLPEDLRAAVAIVDEIRYNPPSREFKRDGTMDVAAAYYDKALSTEGDRIIFVRRDMRWSSDVDLFLTLLHEGVHALQDQRAQQYRQAVPGMEAERDRLLADASVSPDRAAALDKEIAKARDYAKRWFEGKPSGNGPVTDIAFECEALSMEIRAARAIDAPTSAVEDSQYLNVCDDARVLLVRWKDSRLLGGARR